MSTASSHLPPPSLQRMKPSLFSLALAASILGAASAVEAQTITVSANPPLMRVNTAVAGSQPTQVVTATTTYTVVVSSGGARRITGRLLAALPAGTTLTVSLAAPPGATSLGAVALDLTERDLVINVPRPTNSTRAITYTFTATVTGGVIANTNRQVRFRVRT